MLSIAEVSNLQRKLKQKGMEDYIESLINKKAKEDNTICLNAYAKGIEDSRANEMLEMLKVVTLTSDFDKRYNQFGINNSSHWTSRIKELIKQATDI